MKTYKIVPLSKQEPDSKWTIVVEQKGRSVPTFQSFVTEHEAQLMVARMRTFDGGTLPAA